MTPPRPSVKPAALGLALLILAALLFAGVEWASPDFSDARGQASSPAPERLAEVLAGWQTRPVEARLGGGLPHARYDRGRPTLAALGLSPARSRLLELEAELERRRVGSFEADFLSARLTLLRGEADRAVQVLEDLADREPESALAWSDLAAAHLDRASSEDEPFALIRALAAAQRAVAIDPNLPEARFNRALALERLGLRRPARDAWKAAAEVGNAGDGWTEEAQERTAALVGLEPRDEWEEIRENLVETLTHKRRADVSQLGKRFPTAARQLLGETVLPGWGAAWEGGRFPEARSWLRLAEELARSLAEGTGDQLFLEAVESINDASMNSNSLAQLARGYRAYGEAMAHYSEYDIAKAALGFSEARDALQRAGSSFAYWVDFQLARCTIQANDYGLTLTRLDKLLADLGEHSYPSLRGRAQWVIGLTHHFEGTPARANVALRRSLEWFESYGDNESAAVVHSLLADAEITVGQERKAWTHYVAALRALPHVREPPRRTIILSEAALAALELGEPEAAAALLDARIVELDGASHPVELAVLFRDRALIELHAGRPAKAIGYLRRAAIQVDRVGQAEVWKSLAGDVFALEGWLARERDPAWALAKLNEAVALYRETDYGLRLAQLLHQRALVHLEAGQEEDAEQDLLDGIAVRESQRASMRDPLLRLGHFATTRTVYQDLVRLRARQRRAGDALEAAEQGRSRYLLDLLSGLRPGEGAWVVDAAIPVSTQEIQERLPSGTGLLVFQVFEDQTLSWAVTRTALKLEILPEGREDWQTSVAHLNRALGRGEDFGGGRRDALHERLFRQLEIEELAVDRWVVVPDGPLWGVPFEALSQRHAGPSEGGAPVVLSPSASVYLRDALRPHRHGPAGPPALVLGDPDLPLGFTGLPRLPGAREEARAVARVYGVEPLLGEEATRNAFLTLAPSARVLHVAAHAEINHRNPWLSALVLAPGQGESEGRVYAYELLDLDLSRTELAVLTGCRVASAEADAGEGVSALVHALMAAGVPTVVASRWDVRDDLSTSEIRNLHRFITQGLDAERALERLRDGAQPGSGRGGTASDAGRFDLAVYSRLTRRRDVPLP